MKQWTFLFTTAALLLITINLSSAQDSVATKGIEVILAIDAGFGQEDLDWTIAGNLQGKNPNILSELIWKKVRGPVLDVSTMIKLKRHFLFFINSGYQRNISGDVTDTDYQGDDRTNQSFHAAVDCERGYVFNIQAGTGYRFYTSEQFALDGLVGYHYERILLALQDDDYNNMNLNSSYENIWKGIMFSIGATWEPVKRFSMRPLVSYKQLDYNAVADWNLIEEFQHPKSFTHVAKGYGVIGDLALAYKLTKIFSVRLRSGYMFCETGKGTDTVFLQTGQIQKTQLNGVARSNFKLTLGVTIKL